MGTPMTRERDTGALRNYLGRCLDVVQKSVLGGEDPGVLGKFLLKGNAESVRHVVVEENLHGWREPGSLGRVCRAVSWMSWPAVRMMVWRISRVSEKLSM